jgi:hypothetical protein
MEALVRAVRDSWSSGFLFLSSMNSLSEPDQRRESAGLSGAISQHGTASENDPDVLV